MQNTDGASPRLISSAGLVLLAAGVVTLILGWLAVHDPVYGSDAGYRVFFGERPVVRLGNRMWLPFVQIHIWLYHLLGLPVAGLKLVTVAYFGLGLGCLGLYWRQVLGNNAKATLWGVAAVLCFAGQALPQSISELMQEQAGFGLFFLFVWLASRERPMAWAAVAVGCAAMMTRDAYWFYLAAFTLVDLWSWPWGKRRLAFYGALWATPVVWMLILVPAIYFVAYGRAPEFPLEWPLMYNPTGHVPTKAETLASIWSALTESRVVYVAAGVCVAALLVGLAAWRAGRGAAREGSEFARLAMRAVPLAVLVVYGLIMAIDPWQETPGNQRQAWPLLELAYVVAPLLLRAAMGAPGMVRVGVAVAILAGMASGIELRGKNRREISHAGMRAELAKARAVVEAPQGPRRRRSVCAVARSRWDTMQDMSGLMFHHRHTHLQPEEALPGHCEVLLVEDGAERAAGEGWERRARVNLGRRQWTVYARPRGGSKAAGN